MKAASLIRDARRLAGLTQAQLARQIGTTQPAVARLERENSNPTIDTLERALQAAGYRLELRARPATPAVDETLFAAQLRMTPAERLRAHTLSHRNLRKLLGMAKPAGDGLA